MTGNQCLHIEFKSNKIKSFNSDTGQSIYHLNYEIYATPQLTSDLQSTQNIAWQLSAQMEVRRLV